MQGIGVVADTRRIYPNEALAAQVLGFTDSDGKGIEGLEHSQDALLRGQDGLARSPRWTARAASSPAPSAPDAPRRTATTSS